MNDHADRRLRELTYRLVAMAPEAPELPGDAPAPLSPRRGPALGRPGRRPLATAAVAFAAVLLVGVPLLVWTLLPSDEGPDGPQASVPPGTIAPLPTVAVPPGTTVAPATTLPPPSGVETPVLVYFAADYVASPNVPGPHLVAVARTVQVPPDGDAASRVVAVLEEALAGPSAEDRSLVPGIATEVPAGTRLGEVLLGADGTVIVDFDPAFEAGGGSASMRFRLAQIVYTATQFPGVDAVTFSVDGRVAAVFSNEGIVLDGPQTRADYDDVLPAIFVESPAPGEAVSSPIRLTGTANTFEATLEYEVAAADGVVLGAGFATATCGTGCRGDFDFSVEYALETAGPGVVVLYESSAEDGRRTNVVTIPVHLDAAVSSLGDPYLDAYADVPGGAPLDGAVVVSPSLSITGSTNAASRIDVGGISVDVVGESFTFPVELSPGPNEIHIRAGLLDASYTVTYVPGGSVHLAFLTSVSPSSVSADYAEWLTGAEADQAAAADGVIAAGDTVPNGYYIRNQDEVVIAVPVDPDATVTLPSPALGPVVNVAVPFDEWLGLFRPDGTPWEPGADGRPEPGGPHYGYFGAGDAGFAYWLTLDAAGRLVAVTGQYRP